MSAGSREQRALDINMDINVNIIALTDPHQTFAQYIGPDCEHIGHAKSSAYITKYMFPKHQIVKCF